MIAPLDSGLPASARLLKVPEIDLGVCRGEARFCLACVIINRERP